MNPMPPIDRNVVIEQQFIECRELLSFDATNLDAVGRAFHSEKPLWLRQAWLPKPETAFTSGWVRVGWLDNALLVFAELTDVDIFTKATTSNQRLWELGDTFEIFLQPAGKTSYVEFQIAPNNVRLRLRYMDDKQVELVRSSGSVEPFLISDEVFHSTTWVQPVEAKWFVYASIPMVSVCEKAGTLAGEQWRFSFSRYDYTGGRREPVVSSTSLHARADFHSQKEWGTMRFQSRY
jgi:hypothetical protein